MNLSGINLNLLVALDALLTERSVTRAALRLGLSQPAMSNALARLRDMFADPLLVRTPQGLAPTTRGHELAQPVRQALDQISRVVQLGVPFDAATSTRTFALATTDYGSMVVLPRLLHRLENVAPRVRLHVRPLRGLDVRTAFQEGDLDLAITWRIEAANFDHAGFYTRTLFEDRLVCVVRKGHPTAREPLTMKQFTELDHIVVAPSEEFQPIVDVVLGENRLQRKVAALLPHFLATPFVVAQSDRLATVAERIITALGDTLPLRVLKPPVTLPPLVVRLVWHERTHLDPANVWLRELLGRLDYGAVPAGKRHHDPLRGSTRGRPAGRPSRSLRHKRT
jgi:DNA-binding transcriptional LysR family regulator